MIFLNIGVVLLMLLMLVLSASFVCFMIVFYSPKRKPLGDKIEILEGKEYEAYTEQIITWTRQVRSLPRTDLSITSRDGLTLVGKYYEYEKDSPVEIMFHGYRGTGERDLCGGVERCFKLGRSALVVDHRAAGLSDGRVITFGIKEHLDCLDWVNFAVSYFGKERKLLVTGISMGAATVLMAAAKELPESVVGVLADCPYTTPRDIIRKVVRDLHLPVSIFYPLIRLGAIVFGRFDPESYSPLEAVSKITLPTIFIHGDTDGFVPVEMSHKLFEECSAVKKELLIVPGADHGLAYPKDSEEYLKRVAAFQTECYTASIDNSHEKD